LPTAENVLGIIEINKINMTEEWFGFDNEQK
jgi:hypothetical protein